MEFNLYMVPTLVNDSYSRQLDRRVAASEMPYGYNESPPSADTGDYNSEARVSKKEYPLRKGRAV